MGGSMLLKWIVCDVPAASRASFSWEQERWAALSGAPGFLGQVGGWDREKPGAACVLGLWSGRAGYEHFMADLHDRVFLRGGQAGTYASIDVTLLEDRLPMVGSAGALAEALSSARFLRVADCLVRAGSWDRFERVQRQVWAPGMAKSGMLGGAFGRSIADPRRAIVFSAWPSERGHAGYVAGPFPGLRARAAPESDLDRLDGCGVRLEPRWSVAP